MKDNKYYHRCVKSPKGFWCNSCEKLVMAKTYRIELENGKILLCLNCGERGLISIRLWHKNREIMINKAIRKLRSHPKDRVVQRLG